MNRLPGTIGLYHVKRAVIVNIGSKLDSTYIHVVLILYFTVVEV